jgi:hypothetical protein
MEKTGRHLTNNTCCTCYCLTDAEALDQVQKMHVFLGYAEPNSKLARERYYTTNPGFESNIVTTGGSGFGLMTIIGS